MPHKTPKLRREEFDYLEMTLEGLNDTAAAARKTVSAEFRGGRCPSKAQLASERRLADAHRRIEQICNEVAKLEYPAAAAR